jgi:hypothetical protein
MSEEEKNNMLNAAKNPQQNNLQVPDARVQQNAAAWMSKHTWYRADLNNTDSKIAHAIDVELTNEGWDPATPDYWDELDTRMQRYLPQKSNSGYNAGNVQQKRPRSVMTSSGRETMATTKSNEFRLSPDRVAAMKEAGLWDNQAARQTAIRKYAEWDKTNKLRG